MSEGEKNRLIAWHRELELAHRRLREALRRARDALDAEDLPALRADLVLYCRGFCSSLSSHHVGEDAGLFPVLSARHPRLRSTIAALEQDHAMIATLLADFARELDAAPQTRELSLHLEGLAAIMESHFAFEERRLLGVLSTLEFDADPRDLLGEA